MAVEIASAGTLVAAALETIGLHYQSLVLDALENPFSGAGISFSGLGALLYIVAGMSALMSVAITGRYKLLVWFLVGPGMFYAVCIPRTATHGVHWLFGDENRGTVDANNIAAMALSRDATELPPARVSGFFWAYVAFIDKPIQSLIKLVKRGEIQQDMRFMLSRQLWGVMSTDRITDTDFREFVHLALLGLCRDNYAAAETVANLELHPAQIADARLKLVRPASIFLEGGARRYVLNLLADYAESPDANPNSIVWKMIQQKSFAQEWRARAARLALIRRVEQGSEEISPSGKVYKIEGTHRGWYHWKNLLYGVSRVVELGNPVGQANKVFFGVPLPSDLIEQSITEDAGKEEGIGDGSLDSATRGANRDGVVRLPNVIGKLDIENTFREMDRLDAARPANDPTRAARITAWDAYLQTKGFDCEEVWNLTFVGLHREGRAILNRTLGKTSELKIREADLLREWTKAAGYPMILIENPLEQEIDEGDRLGEDLTERIHAMSTRKMLIYRALAKSLIRNELIEGAPASVVAAMAKRGQSVRDVYKGENELAGLQRAHAYNIQWQERTRLVNTAASLPYYQGIVLYLLTMLYPFFAFLLVVPGMHGGYLMWFALWLWAKSWDIGFAIVMLLDDVFYNVFTGNFASIYEANAQVPALAATPGLAFEAMKAADPTFNLSTYYGVVSVALNSVPIATAYLLLGGMKAGAGLIAEGISNYANVFASAAWKTTSNWGVVGYRVSTLDRKIDDAGAYQDSDDGGRPGFRAGRRIREEAPMTGEATLREHTRIGAMGVGNIPITSGMTKNSLAATSMWASGLQGAIDNAALGSRSVVGSNSATKYASTLNPQQQRAAAREVEKMGKIDAVGGGLSSMASTLSDVALGVHRDALYVEQTWAGIDSMGSKRSLRDMEDSRIYDVFELPFLDSEQDGNRAEFERFLNDYTRNAKMSAAFVDAVTNSAKNWQAARSKGQKMRNDAAYRENLIDSMKYDVADPNNRAINRRARGAVQANFDEAGLQHQSSKDLNKRHDTVEGFKRDTDGNIKLDASGNFKQHRMGTETLKDAVNPDYGMKRGHTIKDIRAGVTDKYGKGTVKAFDEFGKDLKTLDQSKLDLVRNKLKADHSGNPAGMVSYINSVKSEDMGQAMRDRLAANLADPRAIKTGGGSAQSVRSESQIVRLGVLLPLTGPLGRFGLSLQNGLSLAYHNLAPAVRDRIELIVRDDKFSSARAVSEFDAMLSDRKLDFILGGTTQTAGALALRAEQERIPFLSFASEIRNLAGLTYTNSLWVRPESQVETLLEGLRARGVKRIARVSTACEWSVAMNKAFDTANEGVINVAFDHTIEGSDPDFRRDLVRLKAISNLDAIVLTLLPGQLGLFAKHLKLYRIDLPMFGYEQLEDQHEVRASDGALQNQVYSAVSAADEEFVERYRKLYPGASVLGAAHGYDALNLLAKAIEEKISNQQLPAFLRNVDGYTGVLGRYSATGNGYFTLVAELFRTTAEGSVRED